MRSVIRLFVFITVLSPAAAGITIQSIAAGLSADAAAASRKFATSTSGGNGSAKSAVSNYRAVSISGMLSLVRTSLPVGILPAASPKDNKKKAINAFVMKCRRVFQVVLTSCQGSPICKSAEAPSNRCNTHKTGVLTPLNALEFGC